MALGWGSACGGSSLAEARSGRCFQTSSSEHYTLKKPSAEYLSRGETSKPLLPSLLLNMHFGTDSKMVIMTLRLLSRWLVSSVFTESLPLYSTLFATTTTTATTCTSSIITALWRRAAFRLPSLELSGSRETEMPEEAGGISS